MSDKYIGAWWCTDGSHSTAFVCRDFVELSIKLFNARMRAKTALTTYVATAGFG